MSRPLPGTWPQRPATHAKFIAPVVSLLFLIFMVPHAAAANQVMEELRIGSAFVRLSALSNAWVGTVEHADEAVSANAKPADDFGALVGELERYSPNSMAPQKGLARVASGETLDVGGADRTTILSFRLRNAMDRQTSLILDLGSFLIDKASIEILDSSTGQALTGDIAGLQYSFNARSIKRRQIAFPIELMPRAGILVTVRITSKFPVTIRPVIYDSLTYYSETQQRQTRYFAAYGFLAAFALFAGILALALRETTLHLFVFLVISLAVFSSVSDGYLYGLSLFPWRSSSLMFLGALPLPLAGIVLFSIGYLELRAFQRGIFWLLVGLVVCSIGASVFYWSFDISGEMAGQISATLMVAVVSVCMIGGVQAWRRGEPFASYQVLAMCGLISVWIFKLTALGSSMKETPVPMTIGLAECLALIVPAAIGLSKRIYRFKTRAEVAERETAFKNELLAKISHELRTPMNGIAMPIQLLMSQHLAAEQKRLLDIISSSYATLITVVDQVLDYTRLEAKKLTLEQTEFDLQRLVDECRTVYGAVAEEKQIAFEVAIDAAIQSKLVGDPVRLGQVLNNVLNNAFKFTEHGAVRLSVMPHGIDTDGKYGISFAISDTGIGMHPSQVEALFKPFEQADSSIARRFGGAGLGLSICEQLLALMDSKIRVESALGKGTVMRFDISFRLPSPASQPAEDYSHATDGLRRLTFLVIGPDRLAMTSLANALADTQVEVVYAKTRSDIIRTTRSISSRIITPDVILVDMTASSADAATAIAMVRLAEQKAGVSPGALAISIAGPQDCDIRAAQIDGVDFVCQLPLDADEVGRVADRIRQRPAVVA